MHQTKKQWHIGMKPHFGVDGSSNFIHAAVATPANVADRAVLPNGTGVTLSGHLALIQP